MIGKLTYLRWKETWRGPIWQKNLIVNIILGISLVYLLCNFLFIGFFLDDLLIQMVPNVSPMDTVNRYLIYYFGFDLVFRFFLQNMPLVSVQPLLHLPIRKNRLVIYLLNKTLPHYTNLVSLAIIVPFALEWEDYAPASEAIVWLVMLLAWIITSNFFSTGLKHQLGEKNNTPIILGLLFLSFLVVDILGLLNLSVYAQSTFGTIVNYPVLLLLPISLAAGTYLWCFRLFRNALTLDHMGQRVQQASAESSQMQALKKWGTWGDWYWN